MEVLGAKGRIEVHNPLDSSVVVSNETGVVKDKLTHSFPERFAEAFANEINTFIDIARKFKAKEDYSDELKKFASHEDSVAAAKITSAAQNSRLKQVQNVKVQTTSPIAIQRRSKSLINLVIFGAGRMGM